MNPPPLIQPPSNPYSTPKPPPLGQFPSTRNGNRSADEKSGLGGWLWLVGIGIVTAPFRILFLIAVTYGPIIQSGQFADLSSPSSDIYVPGFMPLAILEIAINGMFIVAYTFLCVLFFTKSRWFPKVFIATTIANLLFIVLDAFATTAVFPQIEVFDADTAKAVVRSVISAAIWVPYMLVSKRVKNTFV